MSDRTDPQREKDERPDFDGVVEFACPVCPAGPGESCVGGIAEREGVPHPPRAAAYLDAVVLTLGDRKARLEEFNA